MLGPSIARAASGSADRRRPRLYQGLPPTACKCEMGASMSICGGQTARCSCKPVFGPSISTPRRHAPLMTRGVSSLTGGMGPASASTWHLVPEACRDNRTRRIEPALARWQVFWRSLWRRPYPEWKKRIAAEETARGARRRLTDLAGVSHPRRAVLMEAALAVRWRQLRHGLRSRDPRADRGPGTSSCRFRKTLMS